MATIPRETRILLDQNAPKRLVGLLSGFDVRTAFEMGWSRLSNGDLIAATEMAGFHSLITADQNLRYQQNITNRSLGILVLETNRWIVVRANLDILIEAIRRVTPGAFVEIAFDPDR